jgi:hypothetical protein
MASHGSSLSCLRPRATLLALLVDVEHLDLDLLIDLDHVARVIDPAPRHVGDVQQAVEATEVDERAEVGDVLDHALAHLLFLDLGEEGALELLALLFDEAATRDDDVHAVFVDLDDAGFDLLALPLTDVLGATNVDLRGGQERVDADVDEQSALDLARDEAADDVAFAVLVDDRFPSANAIRLALADLDHALAVVEALDQDFELLTGRDFFRLLELGQVDLTLRLRTDVDVDVVAGAADDRPLDDLFGEDIAARVAVDLLEISDLRECNLELLLERLGAQLELLDEFLTVVGHAVSSWSSGSGSGTCQTTGPTRAHALRIGAERIARRPGER